MDYTPEDIRCPWDYGDSRIEESDSEWDGDSNKPVQVPIPENLRRPGSSILRNLSEDLIQNSSFDVYCARMRETFRVERLEDSSIEYMISTTKKFLDYVSRNIDEFPENNGINHQVNRFV